MCLLPPVLFAVSWFLAFAQTRSFWLSTAISAGGVVFLMLVGWLIWRKLRRKEEAQTPARR